jgi:DNA-binding NarL/FixJ family response regulator
MIEVNTTGKPGQHSKRNVLIVDDNSTVRDAVAMILNEEPDLQVCGEARNFEEALAQNALLIPDVVLVDLSLKGPDGIQLIHAIRESSPARKLIVFSLHDESFYIDAAKNAGAHGYIIKGTPPKQMTEIIRSILGGGRSFPG